MWIVAGNSVSISRVYQETPLKVGAIIRLDEKASHHLGRVLRAGVNDKVTLFKWPRWRISSNHYED